MKAFIFSLLVLFQSSAFGSGPNVIADFMVKRLSGGESKICVKQNSGWGVGDWICSEPLPNDSQLIANIQSIYESIRGDVRIEFARDSFKLERFLKAIKILNCDLVGESITAMQGIETKIANLTSEKRQLPQVVESYFCKGVVESNTAAMVSAIRAGQCSLKGTVVSRIQAIERELSGLKDEKDKIKFNANNYICKNAKTFNSTPEDVESTQASE